MVNPDNTQELFLFSELQTGKEYAFDFFFNYYYSGLCVYAEQYLPGLEEEARNLVQDVFLKFWEDRQRIAIQRSVRAYLFTSVRNKCLDFLKKASTRHSVSSWPLSSEPVVDDSETFVESELEAIFMKGLEKLPPRCREVFELSRFEGLRNPEIAQRLNVSEKTVENQITKALRILRVELKDYLPLLLLFQSYFFLK